MVTTPTIPSPPPSTRPGSPDPAPAPTEPRARRLGRRPSLPAGRAIVGGLLVSVAAIGTFAAYANATAGPARRYVVATAPLRAGQRLGPDDLHTVALDLPDGLDTQAYATVAELDGAVALAPIEANQLVAPAAVRLAGSAGASDVTREFSFALDREKALSGRLQRGELIDAVATYGTGSDAYSRVVVRGARVVDVDTGAKGTVGSSGKVTITVALADDRQVLEAMHAIEIAKVTLVRTSGEVAVAAGEGSTTSGTYRPQDARGDDDRGARP